MLGLLTPVLATTFSLVANGQSFLTNGLAAYYPLNRNANDESGNSNNGTIQGATWRPGVFRNNLNRSALCFAGAGRVVVSDAPSLDPANAITLAAWFKADTWNGNNRILCKGDLEYDFTAESGRLSFNLNNGSVSTTLPSTMIWHHAVATYDGAAMKIYLDGKMEAQHPASGVITSAGTPDLNIGAKPDSSNPVDFFRGCICNVRIYTRALSINEVTQIYQHESGKSARRDRAQSGRIGA